jgi:hypothetical protein
LVAALNRPSLGVVDRRRSPPITLPFEVGLVALMANRLSSPYVEGLVTPSVTDSRRARGYFADAFRMVERELATHWIVAAANGPAWLASVGYSSGNSRPEHCVVVC